MGIKFREFAMAYLDYSGIYNADKTMDGKARYVRRFVEAFGDHDLGEIKRADIERYIRTRKESGAGVPTLNREIATLKNLFNYGIVSEYIECNPVKGIKLLPEVRRPLALPTVTEVEAWLIWCLQNDLLLYDLSVIAVNTGLRRGDILKICGEDIDLERHILAVAVSKTRTAQYLPLNDVAYRVLSRRKVPGFIFINGSTHIKSFRRRFRRAKSATGLPCRFHDFRHFFATEIHARGASIRTVQKLLGHARVETTERYTEVVDAGRRQAVELLQWNMEPQPTLFEM